MSNESGETLFIKKAKIWCKNSGSWTSMSEISHIIYDTEVEPHTRRFEELFADSNRPDYFEMGDCYDTGGNLVFHFSITGKRLVRKLHRHVMKVAKPRHRITKPFLAWSLSLSFPSHLKGELRGPRRDAIKHPQDQGCY